MYTHIWCFPFIRLVRIYKRTHSLSSLAAWGQKREKLCLCKGLLQPALCCGVTVRGPERIGSPKHNATFLSSLYYSRFLPATALPEHRNQQDTHTHQQVSVRPELWHTGLFLSGTQDTSGLLLSESVQIKYILKNLDKTKSAIYITTAQSATQSAARKTTKHAPTARSGFLAYANGTALAGNGTK